MYGCTHSRIFIQSAWSNLYHVKIKCLIACFYLFLTYISWFCIITLLLPGSSSSSDDVSSNASIRLLSVGCTSFFLFLFELSYKLTSQNFFKHFLCVGYAPVISNSLLHLIYSFLWIYKHEWKRQTWLSWTLLQGLYKINFCPLCMLSLFFQSLGKIGNLSYNCWKFLLGPEECPTVSLLLRHLQPAEAYTWKRKICYVGKHWLPKKSTIINSLFTIFWCLPPPEWHWIRLHFH